jgi:hypothetical protein
MEQVLPFSGSTKQVFFKMRFCNRDWRTTQHRRT